MYYIFCVYLTHRKVDDLQFAVEETSIDKVDLEVMSVFLLIFVCTISLKTTD